MLPSRNESEQTSDVSYTPLLVGPSPSTPPVSGSGTLAVAGMATPQTTRRWRSPLSYGVLLKISAILLVISLVVFIYKSIDFQQIQTWVTWAREHQGEALPLFLILNATLIMFFCPGAIPQLLAGAVFGVGLGAPLCWIGTCVGQTLSFLVGRYLFRNSLANYIEHHYPKLAAVEAAVFKDGEPWKMLFLLRVAPVVPDSLLNYSLAVTSVPLVLYAWVSALALAPYSVLYAYLGSASSNIMDTLSGRTTQTPAERTRQILFTILSLVLGAAAIVYIIMVVKKALSKVLEQAEVDFEATHPHHHHDQVDGEVGDHESQRLLAKADRS